MPGRHRHPGRGRHPGRQRPARHRAPAPRARQRADHAHRRTGDRRRRRPPDPRRHRRRDGHAGHAGPLHHPAGGAAGGRAQGTPRCSRSQGAPRMAAGCGNSPPSAPSQTRRRSPPSQTPNQARMHGRRWRAASPSGLVARCRASGGLPVRSIRPGAISSMMAVTRATATVTGAVTAWVLGDD